LPKLIVELRSNATVDKAPEAKVAHHAIKRTATLLLGDMQRFAKADFEAWRSLVIALGATVH
jgi:hypothetical protein